MDELLNEMNRKRANIETNSVTANKKYFKRGHLIAKEIKEKTKLEESIKQKKQSLNQKDGKSYDKTGQTTDQKQIIENLKNEKEDISKESVTAQLRAKNVPIRLFGETDHDAWQRLRLIEMMDKEEKKGLRNEFQAALHKLENSFFPGSDDLNDQNEKSEKKFNILSVELSLEEMQQLASNHKELDLQENISLISNFIKNMLNLWAEDLNSRKFDKLKITAFKIEAARFEQTSEYLNPLLNRIQKNLLNAELIKSMTDVVYNCLNRDYIKANDIYLQMAIGNAPWPIGVTMVGIHARTGRERISTRHVAHALNDETQRKYLQALKRLMTMCQKKYPTDPSRSMNF